MNKKRTGVVLCLAALVIFTGILVFQGMRQFPQPETENATGMAVISSVTENAVEVQTLDGLASGTGTVISGSERTEAQEKRSSVATDGNDRTPAPTGKDGSAGKRGAEPKQTKESKGPTAPKNSARRNIKSSEKNPGNNKKILPTPSPYSGTPVPAPNAGTSTPAETPEKKVRLTIQCTGILDHRELWKDGIEEVVPDDGIFFSGDCNFIEGNTVYDILKKICREENIALDSQYTPIYGTYYIQGIGNLYEFDCGSESGWKYTVNGIMPGEGCSSYKPDNGDNIVFYYDYQL